ncbi:MAG: FmdB family zinc ribbon protein [bacterium]
MPTYDYRCTNCRHTWELLQPMSAKPVTLCPACGQKTAERLIGMGAAVVFKGGGFYQTDYRSEGYKKAAEADKKASEPATATTTPATPAASESTSPQTGKTSKAEQSPPATAPTPPVPSKASERSESKPPAKKPSKR